MKGLYLITVIFLLTSCSQFNRESQDYYANKGGPELKHGFITYTPEELPKGKKVKIDPLAAKRGEKIYQKHCLTCHGSKGLGDGPMSKNLDRLPRNLIQIAKNVPNFQFFMKVSQWKGEMPGWKNVLSHKEIVDLENYIRSLARKQSKIVRIALVPLLCFLILDTYAP